MTQGSGPDRRPAPAVGGYQGVELRHLRYLVAVAEAGTFTLAAQRIFVAQPTLSQQIRRLEEMIGTALLDRRPDGVRLTEAGAILLEESRTVLSLVEHAVRRSRQAAGLGRPQLRFALPPQLPDVLAAGTAARLWSVGALAGVEVTWLEAPVDAGFSLIRQRRADAALGWLMSDPPLLPHPLEVMTLGGFEPEVWVPAGTGARQIISLAELAAMDVVHGPRRASPGPYDAWLGVLRSVRPDFAFTDPPLRHSLSVTLAFAAASGRPTAVLTGPLRAADDQPDETSQRTGDAYDMVRVRLERHPLTATAAVAWNGDLPRQLQQVLFDTADAAPVPAGC
jgi:DNA-binding transcriptional LysR family regulator